MHLTNVRLKSLDYFLVAYALAATAMAAFIAWGIIEDANSALAGAERDARVRVQATAEAIALEVAAHKHDAQLMTRDKPALFDAILDAPDPDVHLFTLAELAADWFPKALSFTIGDAAGVPLLTDFKGSVGQACLEDMKTSATQRTPLIPLHGLSSIPHFDVSVPLQSKSGRRGIFLVTFTTNNLTSFLNRHTDTRFSLKLVTRPTQNTAPAPAPAAGFTQPVEGTSFSILAQIRPEYRQAQVQVQRQRLVSYLGSFVLFTVAVAWVLWRARQRIRHDTDMLRQLNQTLYDQSVVDPLTGLSNRRHLEERINLALRQGHRDGKALTLAMMDIDHFKRINDQLGHDAGDACLRLLADILRAKTQRPLDSAIRMGGEEFLVCWADTDIALATQLAREIQQDFRNIPLEHADGSDITVSIGLRAVDKDNTTSLDELLREADQALYRAKHDGRDRIEIAGPP